MPVHWVQGGCVMFKRLFFVFLLLTFIPRHSFAQTTIALTPPGSVVAVCEGNTVSLTATSNDPNALFAIAIVSINGQAYVNSGTASATTVDGANRTFTFNSQSFTIGDATTTFEYRVRFGSTFNIAQFGLGGSFQTTNSETITVNPLPTATLTALGGINSVCQNASSPTVNITGVIGTAPFTFTYRITDPLGNIGSNQTIVSDVSGLAQLTVPTNGTTGVYTYELLQIQDGSSTTCSNASTATLTMTISPLPTATISANTLTSCVNSTAPVVTITGLGGTAPYTFTYREITNGTPGSNQTIISNLAGVATFSATVSSAATRNYELVSVQESSATACVNAQTSSVTIVTNINPNATGVDPGLPAICYGTSNFNVTFSGVTGGPDQYRIVWDGTALGAGFTNDGFQAYNTGTNTITVNVPGTVTAGTTYNGTLRLLNSSTGCFLENSSSVTINPLPTAVITASTLSVCLNESTLPTITITATGATAPYTVTYNVTTNGVTVSNLTTLTNLSGVATLSVPTGTAATIVYQLVSVESSVTNCVNAQNASVTVTVNDLPAATITPFSATTFCAGGSVTLNANTGASLSYLWSDASTGSSISNITNSGTYSVTVTNTSTGCFATSTVTTVTVNALPTPGITASGPLTFCIGNSVNLTGTGGTSYLWSNGTNAALTNITTSGTYSVTVTDGNGCQNITSTTVTVNALPTPGITASGPLTFCIGNSVNLTGTGGTSYLWSNGTNAALTNITTSGTYSVTVTDGNGCQNITSTTVTVNALPTPGITASGPLTFCIGNSVNLTGTGGTSYLWSNGTNVALTNITTSGTYSVTVTDGNGCQNITSTTVTVNTLPTPGITASGPLTFCTGNSVNLTGTGGTSYLWSNGTNAALTNITTSGTYSVTVTDGNGCQNITSTTVTVNALPTPGITASGPLTFCVGNSVNLTGTGGTTYLWSNGTNVALTNITTGGTYSVTVTDGNGCQNITSTTVTVNGLPTPGITASGPLTFCVGNSVNLTGTGGTNYLWSNGTNVALTSITTSGTYSVTVTDGNGCQNITSTTVTVNALPTPGITASGPLTFCAGNSVNLTGTGGTTYLWSNGTNAALTNITTSGTYSVTVTDGNGCQNITSTTVTVNPLPTATINANGPLTFCAGGSVSLTASAGNSYLWSNGSNSSSVSNISTSGTYTVTVTDGNGCENTSSPTVITVNALPTAGITTSGPLTFCAGNSVNLTGTGGTTYLWSNGTNAALTNITSSGTYSVTVTDGNGCQNSTSTTITVNPLPTATINANGPLTFCAGGTVNLTASAGNSYLWSNASTASSINNITTSGTYTVTVTDGNGCQNTSSPTTITVNALPSASINASGALTFCAGGSVNLTASAGASYLWSNASTGSSISNISTSGTYTVTVTDGNGCQNTSSPATITVNPLPTATITANGPLTFCAGGSVNLSANAANSYLWSNGSTESSISNITSSGTYTVTITDGNGCKNTSSPTTIIVNALPAATITPNGPTTFCTGGAVNLTANTGVGLNYLWSNGSTGSSISNITTSGNYTVTVTNQNNCSATSAPVTITVNAIPNVTIANPAAVCAPGTVDLTAAGITAGSTAGLSYSYWTNAAATQSLNTPFAIGTAGTYYIKGTNTTTNCASIRPVIVSINPQAAMQINTPAPVCAPGTVDLTATAITNGSAAGLSYTYFTNAAATNVLANPNAVSSSGIYYIKGTPATGCSAIVPVTVTINGLPTLTVNNPAAVCSPQVINLMDASITAGSSSGLNFAYFSNASLTTPVTNAQNVNNSGIFYIRATDVNTGCFRVAPVTVQINAAPQGTLQIPSGNIICENSSLTLNASGANRYQWLLNQQPINGATAANLNATEAGIYAVKFISAQGCETVSSNTINLELLRKPTVQFTVSNACAGVTANFSNTSITSASGGINWLWDFGDGVTSNQFSPGHIYTTPGNYIVRLTATSLICTGFNETTLKTYTVQSAAPGIRYKDVEVLKDIPVTVQARNIGNGYVWSPSTGVNNINAASPSIRVNITTDYTVAITNDIGCTTVDSVLIKVIPGVDIYVPKGFSPNNDGQNDRLYPILVGMRQLNYFRVFNRWGNMIFTTKDSAPQSGWNGLYLGVMQPTGTYTWIAEAVDLQGNIVRKTGTVLLLQ